VRAAAVGVPAREGVVQDPDAARPALVHVDAEPVLVLREQVVADRDVAVAGALEIDARVAVLVLVEGGGVATAALARVEPADAVEDVVLDQHAGPLDEDAGLGADRVVAEVADVVDVVADDLCVVAAGLDEHA
jgi:hypothetical protein